MWLQWAHRHRHLRADWQQVIFSHESRFNLRYSDGRFRVRCYTDERYLSKCVIHLHTRLMPSIMFWMPLGIMDDFSCWELCVNSTATGKLEMFWCLKSYSSFNAFLMLIRYFKECLRLLFSTTDTASFMDCLFNGYVAYWTRLGFCRSASGS